MSASDRIVFSGKSSRKRSKGEAQSIQHFSPLVVGAYRVSLIWQSGQVMCAAVMP